MQGDTGSAAVVGASGFLGSALVSRLQASGIATTAITRGRPALEAGGSLHPGLLTSDTIYWAASTINPLLAESEPERVQADLALVKAVLCELEKVGSSARFVQLSSGGTVYDPSVQPPYAEWDHLGPKGAYGRAKLALEQAVLDLRPKSVVVRIANAYGAGQRAAPGQGVLGHWLRAVRDGRPVEVFGAESTARDYVHVADVTSGLNSMHHRSDLPSVINLGSGGATTLRELLQVIRAVCGDFEVIARPARSFDLEQTWLDIRLAGEVLEWRPQVALSDGVADMWDWLRADHNR